MKNFITLCFIALLALEVSAQGGAAINNTGTPPAGSAGLDIQFNDKGLLIPRMTTTERDAISNPDLGLQIINITTNCLEIYFSPMWQSIYCACTPPAAPTAGTHVSYMTEITWNWNAVSGATGYKYNTINDYNSAVDIGTSTDYTQPGLICNTPYNLYVWAYNSCGNSAASTLSQNTEICFLCGTSSITFNYGGTGAPLVTYGTVVGQNNTCWMDRNLGASQVATAFNDSQAYGDLFQWGRLDDGHQLRNSLTTSTLSSNDVPGHSNYISTTSSPNDWRTPQNGLLWQGVSGTNNPCPSGWRVSTYTELNSERLAFPQGNYHGAFASSLKLTAAGCRLTNGAFNNVGSAGYYWTSTPIGSNAYNMRMYNTNTEMNNADYRVFGDSVRCIKD